MNKKIMGHNDRELGRDMFINKKIPPIPKKKLCVDSPEKVKESTHFTHDGSIICSGDQDRVEVLIFRRLSDSFYDLVSRLTCHSSEESDAGALPLRDEYFYWPSSSSSDDICNVSSSSPIHYTASKSSLVPLVDTELILHDFRMRTLI
jgi:hypothetical protein